MSVTLFLVLPCAASSKGSASQNVLAASGVWIPQWHPRRSSWLLEVSRKTLDSHLKTQTQQIMDWAAAWKRGERQIAALWDWENRRFVRKLFSPCQISVICYLPQRAHGWKMPLLCFMESKCPHDTDIKLNFCSALTKGFWSRKESLFEKLIFVEYLHFCAFRNEGHFW